MKKSLSIFVLIFAVCALFAMNKNDNLSEARGYIEWFGNIPFEYSGFKTTDGKLYLLEVEENADFSVKDIEFLQGSLIYIEGRIKNTAGNQINALRDGVFVVKDFKKIEQ